MNQETNQNTLDPRYKPKTPSLILLSFQHVFAMFSATVLVPMLTGLPISVALFASGIGTLIYILCTKARVPIYLGSSFAYIDYIIAVAIYSAVENPTKSDIISYGPALTGIVVVGIIYVIVALAIKFFGTKWLNKLLPPIVIGPMIMVIGLGLSSSAIANTGLTSGGDWRSVIVTFMTLLIVAFTAILSKGFFKVIPFLIGIIGGYIVAVVLNFIPNGDHVLMDFGPLKEVITNPSQWFAIPKFSIMGWKDQELFAGITMYKANFGAILTVIPLAFATICEHIGDHEVLGKITGKDYIEDPGLSRTLMGDGIATAFAGMIGGPANTSYGENTSVVGMTKIGSVWVTGLAAVFAIALSFCNVFTTLIATIPTAVMGGVCLILYGFIASNGLKTIVDSKLNLNSTRNLIIISVMLVIGIGGAAIFNKDGMKIFTSVALSAIIGILLNVILPKEKEEIN